MHVNQTVGQYYKDSLKIPMRSLAIFAAIFMGIDLFFSLSLSLKDMWRKENDKLWKKSRRYFIYKEMDDTIIHNNRS